MSSDGQMLDDARRDARHTAPQQRPLTLRVSSKGAVSIYGLGRFPCTLYRAQWQRILAEADTLREFIEEHCNELR